MALLHPSHQASDHVLRSFATDFNTDRCGCGSGIILEDLPSDFPRRLTSKLVWTGSDFHDELKYIYHLSENDKIELDRALFAFKELGLDGDLVNSNNFPLPTLGFILQHLAIELHNGKGFFVIRGLDYSKYSVEDNTVIFLGIQGYVAEKRARQDDMGNMLVHIIDDCTPSSPFFKRSHNRHSRSAISFHTDNIGDLLAFQTRSTASRGGNCILSSSYSIYNELASTRPDIIRTLAAPNWPIAAPFYHERPILFYENSRIIFNFFQGALLGSPAHPRPPSLPPLSRSQVEALNILQKLAEKYRLEIPLQVGDMHFVNNLALLHRRDAFELDGQTKRHLVRMWLRSEKLGWDVPDVLRERCGWDEAFRKDGVEEVWHVEPMPDFFFPLRKYRN